jgi:hypothetical protein
MGTGLPRMKHTGMRARAMPSAAILALLVAALVLPASAEESGGTPAPSGTPATPAGILTAAVSVFPMSLMVLCAVRARGTVCSWVFARL